MEKLKGSPALIRSGGIAIWDEQERRYWTFIADHQGGSEAVRRLVLWLNALSRPSGGLDAATDDEVRCVVAPDDEIGENGRTEHEEPLTPPDNSGELREALETLYRAYVQLLESGRDRIVALGGVCDSVEVMEKGDPALIAVRQALAALATTQEDQTNDQG